jgi:hypothetical protein
VSVVVVARVDSELTKSRVLEASKIRGSGMTTSRTVAGPFAVIALAMLDTCEQKAPEPKN